MDKITLDATLPGKLPMLTRPVDVCDNSGRVVGRFIPLLDVAGAVSSAPPLSEVELQRRELEPEYSTAEVLAHLEKLF